MCSKGQASARVSGKPIVHNGVEYEGDQPSQRLGAVEALRTNIQDSLDELDVMRGTVQYWESRRRAADPKERALLLEAFRVMHGELLGLTARMKELLDRTEQAKKG